VISHGEAWSVPWDEAEGDFFSVVALVPSHDRVQALVVEIERVLVLRVVLQHGYAPGREACSRDGDVRLPSFGRDDQWWVGGTCRTAPKTVPDR